MPQPATLMRHILGLLGFGLQYRWGGHCRRLRGHDGSLRGDDGIVNGDRDRLRRGAASSAHGAVRLVRDALATLRRANVTDPVLVRAGLTPEPRGRRLSSSSSSSASSRRARWRLAPARPLKSPRSSRSASAQSPPLLSLSSPSTLQCRLTISPCSSRAVA